ncbi:PPE domain-containing protein [Mycobacterium sp. HNNTM2301]|uniref:PPE family protein, SVP subgroup n=1 Tax=Mycobacterium hainanense TaxID=3289775 RepID=UPI0035A6E565
MDFAALPPEVNSGRMYSGPGSGPLLAAAAAWDGQAAELHSAATAYQSVLANLTSGPWLGPASDSMAVVATAYIDWLTATAEQALQTATQARAAASAYAAAFAMTVPPPAVADNRTLLVALVTTNLLGQNTAAIAATEAQYAEMWAQDATAMYSYASTSASAASLAPFASPAAHAPAGGLASQAGRLSSAATAAPATAHTLLAELTSAIPTVLQRLASPLPSATMSPASVSGLSGILSALGLNTPLSFLNPINTGLTVTSLSGGYAAWGSATNANAQILETQNMIGNSENRITNQLDQLFAPPPSSRSGRAGPEPATVSASSGRAPLVGALAVPQAWAANAPQMRSVAMTLPLTAASGTDANPATSASLLAETALTNTALNGWQTGGTRGSGRLPAPSREHVDRGSTPPPIMPGGSWIGVAAELTKLAELRESGILTNEEFARQKRRLLGD